MIIKNSLFFCLIIFIYKISAIFYTNFDFFGDEAQYWIWSQQIDLGYYSKPPLLAWLISLTSFIFGDSFKSLKLIPIFMYVFNSYLIYLIFIKIYKNKKEAILGSCTFFLMPAVTVSSFLISTDIILIFFWSLSLLFILKIRELPNFYNFFLLGIFLGLSFLAKYAAIYFLISFILILFFDLNLRKIFLNKISNTLIFLISLLIVLLPNIIWNINNDLITIVHTSDNISLSKITPNIIRGFEFLLVQALMLGIIISLFFIYSLKKICFDFETKFLLIFSLPIFLIIFIESVLVRANANWAAVALISFFILVFHHTYKISKKIININFFANAIFAILFFSLIIFSSPISFFNRINGISEFSSYLEKQHLKEIKILVVTDRLLYSNLKYLLKNTKILMYSPYNPINSIKSHFQISSPLPPLFKESFIFIGNPKEITYLKKNYKIKGIKEKKVVFKKTPIKIHEVTF